MDNDIIPDSDFKPDAPTAPVIDPRAPINLDPQASGSDFVPDEKFQPDESKYGDTAHQIGAAVEGVGEGLLGPLAPLAARAAGVNPVDYRLTKENNPITHGIGEATGFIGGALGGTGEAAVLSELGEGAAALAGLSDATSIGGRIAAGATKAATEMAAMQAGDEGTKLITEDPNQTVGNAAANIGLSALLGGATGGLLSGAGMAAKTGLDALGLKEFADRLAYRGANLNPNEQIQHEAENAYNTIKQMGSEVGGTNGLKAQALQKLMPEMSDKIQSQVPDTVSNLLTSATNMEAKPFKFGTRVPGLIREGVDEFQKTVQNAQSPGEIFDALNDLKKEFDQSIPKNLTPDNDNYHAFRELRNVTGDIRKSLENPEVWGQGVAGLQKNLNSAWTDLIPSIKDYESKFMTKIGGDLETSSKKFQSYMGENGRTTSVTDRQKMMGNFAKAVEKFQNATSDVYEKAGIENPHADNLISMGSIKESLNKPSIGAKLADLWYDKLGAQSLGAGAGALAGNAVLPGLGGAFIGKEVLGPVFGAIIQPIMEKAPKLEAYQQAMKFGKAVLAGNSRLVNSAASIFESGAKTIPEHLYADNKKVSELDEKLAWLQNNPKAMLNVAGDLGHYAPDHAQALATTAMGAVNYLNAQRPKPVQASPLDMKVEPSRVEKDKFNRTLSIAQNPLTVLGHIKDSTLLPSDIQTLKTVYPAYYNKISQELTHAMTDHLAKDGKVPYNTRQSLSLFLGQPLDSTMTPQAIQAVQAMYASKPSGPANAPVTKNKKNTSKLGQFASNLQTQSQKAESRHTSE